MSAPDEDLSQQANDIANDLLDANQIIFLDLRQRAKDWEALAEQYEDLRQWSNEMTVICAEKARLMAELIGDAITAEFGLGQIEVEAGNEEEEDDDDD